MPRMSALAPSILSCALVCFSQEDYAQWSSYKNIAFNTTSGGANVASDQTDFPVLVRLGAAQADVFSGAAVNGADLRFTKSDGTTRIPHQVDHWDAAGQTAEIWVLADIVRGNNNSQSIRMYWGKTGAADSANGSQVFSASKGYAGVWHLSETSGSVGDATANANTGINNGSTTYAAGAVGPARAFNGSNQFITVADDASLDFTSAITVSVWVNSADWSGNRRILQKGGDNSAYGLRKQTDSSDLEWDLGGTSSFGPFFPITYTFQWQLVHATYDGANRKVYVDGALKASEPATGDFSSDPGPLDIGRKPGSGFGGDYFFGRLDEVRIQDAARSDAWIRLEFENQKFNQTLVTLGASIAQNQNAPSGLSYSQPTAVYGISVAIASNNPTVTGSVTNYAVAPALPAGLSINAATGVITGTPTAVSAPANYTVTASNASGSTTATVNIRVIAAPSGLTYRTNPAVFGQTKAVTPDTPSVTGTVSAYSVNPALPAGLALNTATGIVSGTPTVAAAGRNYAVTATNVAGSTSVNLYITVLAPPSGLGYANNPASYTVGTAIASNNPSVTGTISSYSVNPALPAGLSLNGTSGVITGTPAAASAQTGYTVTATNIAGSATVNLQIEVIVGVAAPANLSYSANPAVYGMGATIAPNSPSSTGGNPTHYAVAPTLPAGLVLDTVTGIVTGTPAAASASANFTVTASNAAGSTLAALSITVLAPPSGLTYAVSPANYTERAAITPNAPSVTGTVTRYSSAPPLPAGLLLDSATGVISGTPTTAASAADYVITAENPAGSTSFTLNLSVKLVAPANLVYPVNPAAYPLGADITPNVPSVTGSVTYYAVTPLLPPGLNLDEASGMIWGNPSSDTPPTDYTVSASNTTGTTTVVLRISTGTAIAVFGAKPRATFNLGLPGSGSLRFRLPENRKPGRMRIEILDVRGHVLWNRVVSPDAREALRWDGSSRRGRAANGIYFARLFHFGAGARGTVAQQMAFSLLR